MTKSYDGHLAVRDLSLTVPQGTVYGLLGPNGSGKTTTIRMIMNIIAPDSGTVELFGAPHSGDELADRVGYLPEERGLYRKMRVRDVLRFLAALKGVDGRTADARIDGWLERLSLRGGGRDWGRARIEELSRGMQQKVQFIAALLHEPDLVILDEPFSGLDPMNAQAMKDTVVDLRRQGRTVIFSTHLMDNAERMCDSVCIIAGGEKVLDGAVPDIKAAAGVGTIALALDGGDSASVAALLARSGLTRRMDDHGRHFEIELAHGVPSDRLLALLVEAAVPVRRYEMVQPSLHQIFLQRVGAVGVEDGMSGQG